MLLRFITAASFTLAALSLIALPLSRVALQYKSRDSGVQTSLHLASGALVAARVTGAFVGPLDRPRYTIETGMSSAPGLSPTWWRPSATWSAGNGHIAVPLIWVLAGSLAVAALALAVPGLRARRRARLRLCLACGYARPGEGVCPECGLSAPDAQARVRRPAGRVLGDVGLGLFLTLMACSTAAWMVVRSDDASAAVFRARAFDYSWYLSTSSPRLTGAVAVARPGTGPGALPDVVRSSPPGTTIVLLPGHHTLPDTRAALSDLWLLGDSPVVTLLTIRLRSAERVRIDGVTIECENEPFADLRRGGTLTLKDCIVRGYNSGAGGSNAVFSAGGALLVESCEFEGRSGRASEQPGMRGNAFDLRGDNRVFLRNCRFVGNGEIFRTASGVIDRCSNQGPADPRAPGGVWPTFAPAGDLLVRETEIEDASGGWAARVRFSQAIDDAGPLRTAAEGRGVAAWTDPVARRLARTLGVPGDRAFWRALLLHPEPEPRSIAAKRLNLPQASAAMPLEDALALLKDELIPPRVALSILAVPEDAIPRLTSIFENSAGPSPERNNAFALLCLLRNSDPGLPAFVQHQDLVLKPR